MSRETQRQARVGTAELVGLQKSQLLKLQSKVEATCTSYQIERFNNLISRIEDWCYRVKESAK